MRAGLALSLTISSGLPENVLVSNSPGNAGNRQCQQEQPNNLNSEGHSTREVSWPLEVAYIRRYMMIYDKTIARSQTDMDECTNHAHGTVFLQSK